MRGKIQKRGRKPEIQDSEGIGTLCFLRPRHRVRSSANTTKGGRLLLGIEYVFVHRLNAFKLFIIDMYES
jgi:hypothetical protein